MPLDPELASLLVAIEDRRFRRHPGVDLRSMARACCGLLRGHPSGGGSTIDMQLVRTLTGRYDRTILRKLIEMALALWLRCIFGRDRILDVYGSVAYGGEGIVGLHAIAEHLFKRPISACSTAEKAAIAAILLYPIPRLPTEQWRLRVATRAQRAVRLTEGDQPAAKFSLAAP